MEHRAWLGANALEPLVDVLRAESGDAASTQAALEALCGLVNTGSGDVEAAGANADRFLSLPGAVEALLETLQAEALWVRLNAIQALTALAYARKERLEMSILQCPAGMMHLMEVLGDGREEIRNEVLLLLLNVTESNEEVQKFCAFQEGFDRLFAIMAQEGMAAGGIIVQDCLKIVAQMLRGNELTKKLFAQGRGMRDLATLLSLSPADVPGTSGPGSAAGGVGIGTIADSKQEIAFLALAVLHTLLEDAVGFAADDEAAALARAFADGGAAAEAPSASDPEHARDQQRRQHLASVQVALCSNPDLVEGVLALAVGPHTADESLSRLRASALTTLGLLAEGNAKVQRMFARGTVPGTLRALVRSAEAAALEEDVVYMPTDRPILSAVFEAALRAPDPEEEEAAVSAAAHLVRGNDAVRTALWGHAKTPPPPPADSQSVPPKLAGRALVDAFRQGTDAFVRAAAAARAEAGLSSELGGGGGGAGSESGASPRALASLWLHVRSARLLRHLLRDSETCKDLAISVPVSVSAAEAAAAGVAASPSVGTMNGPGSGGSGGGAAAGLLAFTARALSLAFRHDAHELLQVRSKAMSPLLLAITHAHTHSPNLSCRCCSCWPSGSAAARALWPPS